MSRLSVVLIVKNAQASVRRCLESVSWADEIVVVDDFSTDRTLDICREFTDKIYQQKLRSFDEQRSFAMEQAAGPWILSVDDDDEVMPELAAQIKKAVAEDACEYDGYTVVRMTSYLGRWIRYCGWRNRMLMLFRKERASYDTRRVHEKVIVEGKLGALPGEVRHHAYASLSDHFTRMDLYTTLDAQTFRERGVRITVPLYPVYFLFRPGYAFFRKFILQQGYREGARGLFISVITAFVVFINYAKLWEMQLNRGKD